MGRTFRVNSYEDNWQRNPDVISMADGGFLVVYESYLNDRSDGPTATVVAAQRYDASGRPVGGETVVDGLDGTNAESARATRLSDGGYAVAWTWDDYDPILTIRDKAFVRAYDPDGTPRTGAIRVDTVQSNDVIAPEVVATANGGFKVVFGTDRSGDNFDQIFSQQFDRTGQKIGGNKLVNFNEGEFDQHYARSARLTDGSTITIWNSEGTYPTEGDLDSNEIRGTLFDRRGGVERGDFTLTINYGTVGSIFGGSGGGYDVAALQDGGFVVTNKNYDFDLGLDTDDRSYYTMLRFFDAGGRLQGDPAVVYASDDLPNSTQVAQLENGVIVVVWDQDDVTPGFIGDAIYGRYFSPEGVALSGRFDVSPEVPNYFSQDDPEIAALPGGGFVVTWMSEYIDSDDDGIAARIFGPSDVPQLPGLTIAGTRGNDDREGGGRADELWGGDGNDTLDGRGGADTISGGDGRDVLLGGDGADLLSGGGKNDALYGGAGDDTVYGGGGDDTLGGGAGDDALNGGTGADALWGGANDDVLSGGAGRDTLGGARGNDAIYGAGGADELWGADGSDLLFGGDSGDRVGGGAGADRIFGGNGNDALYGGLGGDAISGDAGDDTLYGGAGDDILDGGTGNDVMFAGSGADVIVFSRGRDVVNFFSSAEDRIDVSDIAAIADFADLRADHLRQYENGTGLVTGDGHSLYLDGIDVVDLGADNFLF